MATLKEIENKRQLIAREENSLALEKLKLRRADTRRKIELGGLVIKSGMNKFDNSTILNVLELFFKWSLFYPDFTKSLKALEEEILNKFNQSPNYD